MLITLLGKEDHVKSARPSDRELSGMTVNERLSACGLFPRWDSAVIGRKKDDMIAVLCEVAIPKEEAVRTADTILADPKSMVFDRMKEEPNQHLRATEQGKSGGG